METEKLYAYLNYIETIRNVILNNSATYLNKLQINFNNIMHGSYWNIYCVDNREYNCRIPRIPRIPCDPIYIH